MRALFIGGTGIISSGCSPLAVAQGIDLTLLNRGTSHRQTPAGVKELRGDINDLASVSEVLKGHTWDVVVNWIAFHPSQIERDIELFKGKCGQYIFISSASAYQTPPASLPVRESTPLDNPFWEYSRNKIACEEALVRAYREHKFPATIVRPSHTYDKTLLPFDYGYTILDRMKKGKPVVVPGDGTSLWTLTHHTDFAKGFVGLMGHSAAIGEAYHITSDEWLTWNQIYDIVAKAAGVEAIKVHVPSDIIAKEDPGRGPGLLGDKTNSFILDNSKIKALVPSFVCTTPFCRGAEEIVRYYESIDRAGLVNPEHDALEDRLTQTYGVR
jgi:nucleoside-diphosphate-sugar epimerase